MMVDCSHLENNPNMDNQDIGIFINPIHFSKPYRTIAGKEGYLNYDLNEVLAQSIYDSIQNNIDYVIKTQHNKNNYYKVFSIDEILKNRNQRTKHRNSLPAYSTTNQQPRRSKTSEINKFENIPEFLKTHNSLKHEPNGIHIHQKIPTINTIDLDKYGNLEDTDTTILKNSPDTMYGHRYNEYPPMNGLGYNHHARNNLAGYTTNTNNKDVSNFTLQQHNMHGRNDLEFADGTVPYGFYDQSNFTGTNHLACGAVQNDPRMALRRNISKDPCIMNYPSYPPPINGYPFAPLPLPLEYSNNKRMGTAYNHECNYNAGSAVIAKPKSVYSSVSEKEHRREINRKNVSKVKKGGIDINIETSASSRQGVSIDLNIGVGN